MKNNIIFMFLMVHFFCLAQVDSLYVKPFRTNASIRFFVASKYSDLTYDYEKEPNKNLRYKPNNPVNIGIGGSYKNSALNIGYGFNFLRNRKKGKTKSFDLQYYHYGRKYIFEVFIQDYKGFYMNEGKTKDTYKMYPDIRLTHVGLSGRYLLNHKKFSYKAAFNQSEQQIKSAGSVQLGGNFFYNRIKSDSSLILKKQNKEQNYQIGINAGYIYTVVIKSFYITGGMTIGVNLVWDNSDLKGHTNIYPAFSPRFSAGYHKNSWSTALSIVNDMTFMYYSDDVKTFFNSGKIQLAVIKRFNFPFKS